MPIPGRFLKVDDFSFEKILFTKIGQNKPRKPMFLNSVANIFVFFKILDDIWKKTEYKFISNNEFKITKLLKK